MAMISPFHTSAHVLQAGTTPTQRTSLVEEEKGKGKWQSSGSNLPDLPELWSYREPVASPHNFLSAPLEERSDSDVSGLSSRALSLGSELEFGLERAGSLGLRVCRIEDSKLFETGASLLDSKADFSLAIGKPAKDKWQRSLQLVEKGLAFNKAFKTLSTERKENVIDPSRLSKIKEVGSGSFAVVELCKLSGEKPGEESMIVAVKRLRPEYLRNRKDLERFFNEAELLRHLDHKYIAKYVGVGNLSKKARNEIATITAKEARQMLKSTFMVQEYINGGSFRHLVVQQMMKEKGMAYTDMQACEWMSQVAEALHYLHTSSPKVVHRDLKLENILLRECNGKQEICLVDFGVSALLPLQPLRKDSASSMKYGRPREPSISEETSMSWRELSGNLDAQIKESDLAILETVQNLHLEENAAHDLTGRTGSYLYMAPEVFQAQQYNEKADVFSFGCIMYEIFSRFVLSTVVVGPSGDPKSAQIYAGKVARGYRRPFPKSLQNTEIADLITDCWHKIPKERPSSAECVFRLLGILKRMKESPSVGRKSSRKSLEKNRRNLSEPERVNSGCFACFS